MLASGECWCHQKYHLEVALGLNTNPMTGDLPPCPAQSPSQLTQGQQWTSVGSGRLPDILGM
jgi:hypothetical protein